jgi:hypothetical protein
MLLGLLTELLMLSKNVLLIDFASTTLELSQLSIPLREREANSGTGYNCSIRQARRPMLPLRVVVVAVGGMRRLSPCSWHWC